MFLYDEKGRTYNCTKTKKPEVNSQQFKEWEYFTPTIDGKEVVFFFRHSGFFFFEYLGVWYKVPYDGDNISFSEFSERLYTRIIVTEEPVFNLSFGDVIEHCFNGEIIVGKNFRKGVYLKVDDGGRIKMYTRVRNQSIDTCEELVLYKGLIRQKYRIASNSSDEEVGVWG